MRGGQLRFPLSFAFAAGHDNQVLWEVNIMPLAELNTSSLLADGSCCVHSEGQGIVLVYGECHPHSHSQRYLSCLSLPTTRMRNTSMSSRQHICHACSAQRR